MAPLGAGVLAFLLVMGFALLFGGEGTPYAALAGFGAVLGTIFAIGTSVILGWLSKAGRAQRTEYQRFAIKIGGKLEREGEPVPGAKAEERTDVNFEILFSHDGKPARLVSRRAPTSWWEQQDETGFRDCITEVILELRRRTVFRCHVRPRRFLKRHGDTSGLQEVELGWPPFDDQYIVFASEEAKARSVLNGEAQRELLALKQWLMSNVEDDAVRDMELAIEDSTLRLGVRFYLAREESLTRLLEAGKALVELANGALCSAHT